LIANGFNVVRTRGEVNITIQGGGASFSNNGGGNTQVLVNEMVQLDLSNLDNYDFCDIDEIYVNRRVFGGGIGSENGVIKIYLKNNALRKATILDNQSQSIVVKNGFISPKVYENPTYDSYSNAAFIQFGTIKWIAEVLTDKDGFFQFKIPDFNQKEVKVLIEGVDKNGGLISVTKILKL
jgi:hypothetical protein